ncbi:MAG: hypothetical protein EVJ46_00195 [Candidatus Acididesulfobacter guangdongensis]|uniref:Uncharacterized protein n=1 Tax=Acididesulfobacter guangdongensis TaxID=2597225 RepID=A0A519BHE5_ACIG2|nr:MAG: hypothetical protein EVJ46_00195 [Candidatus Acididesulfobacter guangdongensis]
MNLHQAKKRVWNYKIISIILRYLPLLLIIFGTLRFIRYTFVSAINNNNTKGIQAFNQIYRTLVKLINSIQHESIFFNFFLKYSPMPILSQNIEKMNTIGNYEYLFLILLIPIGVSLGESAKNLSKRIRRVKDELEEQYEWKKTSYYGNKNNVQFLEIRIEPKDNWYNSLWVKIVTGIAIVVLGQIALMWLGLTKYNS